MFLLRISFLLGLAFAILNNKVSRTVHLYGPNSKSHTTIDILNDSPEGSNPISSYTIALNATLFSNLIEVEARQDDELLQVERAESEDRPDLGIIAMKVTLVDPIHPGEKGKIEVEETYAHRKLPFPKTMKIKDIPKVRVFDNLYYLSFYKSKTTKSTLEFASGTYILSYSKVDKADEKGSAVRFGAYKDVPALSIKPIYVHANYDDSLPAFRNVTRTVSVNHWDKIQVDEFYQLHNEVATLEGEFGRVDYSEWMTHYSIQWLQCSLPVEAHSLYYVDPVGNVSTSNAFRHDDHVSFRVQPRFPVMGGWKTTWN